MPHSHVIGFDDAPFPREHRGNVLIVGAMYAGLRLEGVLSGKVRRDGANATGQMVELLRRSRFRPQLILTQGIAFAGFNVIDLVGLQQATGVPAVAVVRKSPDMDAVRRALPSRVPAGARKWRLIERLGPVEPVRGVYVQRAGISLAHTDAVLARLALSGKLPEPLRAAHLIAGGIALGESRHRP